MFKIMRQFSYSSLDAPSNSKQELRNKSTVFLVLKHRQQLELLALGFRSQDLEKSSKTLNHLEDDFIWHHCLTFMWQHCFYLSSWRFLSFIWQRCLTFIWQPCFYLQIRRQNLRIHFWRQTDREIGKCFPGHGRGWTRTWPVQAAPEGDGGAEPPVLALRLQQGQQGCQLMVNPRNLSNPQDDCKPGQLIVNPHQTLKPVWGVKTRDWQQFRYIYWKS